MKKSLFVLINTLLLFGTLLIGTPVLADGTPNPNCSPTGRMCKP